MEKNITISDIHIQSIKTNGFNNSKAEGIYHKKILNCLSVVQALKGSYDIKIGNSQTFSTGEGGAFIAPANFTQEITHHVGKDGTMTAQWVFIDAVVNKKYSFDELYSFPVLLPEEYNTVMSDLINTIRCQENYFEKIRATYTILEILTRIGTQQKEKPSIKVQIESFVNERHSENITAKDIARHLHCSVSQVFKYTKKYYNFSPANYVNSIRLQEAEQLLLYTKKTVTEIAFSVGFTDSSYFSKLFKKHYACSPLHYRQTYNAL